MGNRTRGRYSECGTEPDGPAGGGGPIERSINSDGQASERGIRVRSSSEAAKNGQASGRSQAIDASPPARSSFTRHSIEVSIIGNGDLSSWTGGANRPKIRADR